MSIIRRWKRFTGKWVPHKVKMRFLLFIDSGTDLFLYLQLFPADGNIWISRNKSVPVLKLQKFFFLKSDFFFSFIGLIGLIWKSLFPVNKYVIKYTFSLVYIKCK